MREPTIIAKDNALEAFVCSEKRMSMCREDEKVIDLKVAIGPR
jgi:hypothetical protein